MSYTNLNYHIVFSTKDRRSFLKPDVRLRLHPYMGGIARTLRSVLLDVNVTNDHVHLVAGVHPSLPLSGFVRDVKTNATRWLRETFPALARFGWQDEYAAFTVSHSQMPAVLRYVREQEEHHRTLTFDQELRRLLEKHEIEVDERYVPR